VDNLLWITGCGKLSPPPIPERIDRQGGWAVNTNIFAGMKKAPLRGLIS